MIKDHDIEIDSLLRRLAKTEANAEEIGSGHIDADEIAVFAENALPEKARARMMSHFADCARCRTILSNVVILNRGEEASEPETAAGAAISFEIPWYKKLFSVRGLAAVMGVLVVLMAGFFAVSLFRNLGPAGDSVAMSNTNSSSSESPEQIPEASANRVEEKLADSNSSPANANAATAETESDLAPAATPGVPSGPLRDEGFADRRVGEERARENVAADDEDAARPQVSAGNRVALANEPSVAAPPPPAADVRPAGNVAQAAEAAKPDDAAGRVARKDKAELGTLSQKKETGAKRQISGKTFEQKDGVWYDSAYKGQQTTNVRRKTPEYRALDSGLRQITDKLTGTVVVVWKSKAYRID
ncbi:MAG: hypothetical protein IPM63_15990 [Acidobacteriota bacterium]|nr:MAG: hypothetical protein IPM63_15990 [Acidobacteriota bacterium]